MDKPDPKGPNDGETPLNSSGGRVRMRLPSGTPAPGAAGAPPEAAAGESEPPDGASGCRGGAPASKDDGAARGAGEPPATGSSPRVRRRRVPEAGTPGTVRTGGKPPPSSLAALNKPRAPRVWLRRLAAGVLVLAVAAGGWLAWWHLVWLPRQAARVLGELAAKPTPAPKPLPAVPALPALYLPPRPKAGVLPRAYRTEALGLEEAALRKKHQLEAPAKADPWCDGFRSVKEPPAIATGYKFAAGKVCELAIRYVRDCPYIGRMALEKAIAVYGPPAGQYTYRADALLHTVQFWDDGKTMLKLDCRQDGPDSRLHAFELLDKATSVERAIQK